VDWITDPRCQALPHNDARWLHEVMWRMAVKERTPILPEKYTLASLAAMARITEERAMECIQAIAAENLIGFTSDDARIVVWGVVENHPKISWRAEYPETHVNPYAKPNVRPWIEDMGACVPISPHTGTHGSPIEKEKEKERKRGDSGVAPYGAQPPPSTDDPVYITFRTIGAEKQWELRKSLLDEFWRVYGTRLDVLGECKKAHVWLEAKRGRLKTARGMRAFLVNWLNRACDSGKGWGPISKEQAKADAERLRRAQEARRRARMEAPVGVGNVVGNMMPERGEEVTQ